MDMCPRCGSSTNDEHTPFVCVESRIDQMRMQYDAAGQTFDTVKWLLEQLGHAEHAADTGSVHFPGALKPLSKEERAKTLARLRNVNSCHHVKHWQDVERYEATVADMDRQLAEARAALRRIAYDVSVSMPAAWNDEPSWYRSQLMSAIGIAARALDPSPADEEPTND